MEGFDFDTGNYKKQERRQPMWLVSFADLMSLLFAMFVMLLSFADFNKDKLEKSATPIAEAFDAPGPKTRIIPPPSILPEMNLDLVPPKENPIEEESGVEEPAAAPAPSAAAQELATQLRETLARELKGEMVEVLEEDNAVVIRFRDRAAFAAGERELSPTILPALDNIVKVLSRTPGRIRVEGHTDNVPISTGMFRSNWDLSATRAATVVQYLLQSTTLAAGRVSAEGFADSRPLAGNDTPEDRARNRRVEILIELPTASQIVPPAR